MNEPEHLTNMEIAGYYAGTFPEREEREIGRHLLLCAQCRSLLPAPSAEVFLAALTVENETKRLPSREQTQFSRGRVFSPIFAFSFAVLLLFFGAGAIYFIFFNGAGAADLNAQVKSEGERVETARLENKPEINAVVINPASVQKSPAPVEKKPSPRAVRKLILPEKQNRKNTVPTITQSGITETERVALVRGNTNSLTENKTDAVDAKISVSGDHLKLSWSKYPQAVRYSVTVANAEDNELIDEIKLENQTETSISLKKLKPSKKYEIRVAAVLPDGVIKTSKTFTLTKNFRRH